MTEACDRLALGGAALLSIAALLFSSALRGFTPFWALLVLPLWALVDVTLTKQRNVAPSRQLADRAGFCTWSADGPKRFG